MNKTVAVIVFMVLQISAFAQEQLIVLHPAVGDTIDRNERNVFLLFPEITNADFMTATIQLKTDKLYLHVLSKSGLDAIEIDSIALKQNRDHVEKLLEYFAYLLKKENDLIEEDRHVDDQFKFEREILTPKQRKNIAIEARKFFDLNQDAEEMRLWGIEKENYMKVNSHSGLVELLFDIVK